MKEGLYGFGGLSGFVDRSYRRTVSARHLAPFFFVYNNDSLAGCVAVRVPGYEPGDNPENPPNPYRPFFVDAGWAVRKACVALTNTILLVCRTNAEIGFGKLFSGKDIRWRS